MRRWGRLSAIAAALTVVGWTTLVGSGVPAHALPTPVGPVSLGQATFASSSGLLTLNGSIAVGNGEFNGVASGTPTSTAFPATNRIAPFGLTGPGLQGTCSGHWLISPVLGGDPITGGLIPLPNPVIEASLACTLQLGAAPAADTGLSVVGVELPSSSQYTGLFGPGPSSLPLPSPVSMGTLDSSVICCGGPARDLSFVGNIALGGQVFHGDATASFAPGDPFALTGISPSGNLTATCVDTSSDLVTSFSCTGSVGAGPQGTTTLYAVLPLGASRNDLCSQACETDRTGVFLGV